MAPPVSVFLQCFCFYPLRPCPALGLPGLALVEKRQREARGDPADSCVLTAHPFHPLLKGRGAFTPTGGGHSPTGLEHQWLQSRKPFLAGSLRVPSSHWL